MKTNDSKVDYTPVNLSVANMCMGVPERYSIEELQDEILKWSTWVKQLQVIESFSAHAQRANRNNRARVAALSESIQDIRAGAFQ